MTRFSFLLFNVLLILVLYGLVWFEDGKETVSRTLYYFSLPYITTIIAMAVLSTVRWFMGPDEEIMKSAVTYWHAAWICALFTFLAVKFLNDWVHSGFFRNIGGVVGH